MEPFPALDRAETRRRQRNLLEASGLGPRLLRIAARQASDASLLRFHTPGYLERVAALGRTGGDTGESAVIAAVERRLRVAPAAATSTANLGDDPAMRTR